MVLAVQLLSRRVALSGESSALGGYEDGEVDLRKVTVGVWVEKEVGSNTEGMGGQADLCGVRAALFTIAAVPGAGSLVVLRTFGAVTRRCVGQHRMADAAIRGRTQAEALGQCVERQDKHGGKQ